MLTSILSYTPLAVTGTLEDLGLANAGYSVDEPRVTVIAVLARDGTWAAYIGGASKAIDVIARSGIKVRHSEGIRFFPVLNPERWRR